MAVKRKTNTYVDTNKLDGVSLSIYHLIVDGRSDKEIANMHNVPISVVKTIKKKFSKEIQESKNELAIQKANSVKTNDKEKLLTDTTEKPEDTAENKPRSKGYRTTDDDKLKIAELFEEGVPVKKICEIVNLSPRTVRRVGEAFGVYTVNHRDKKEKEIKTPDTEVTESSVKEQEVKDDKYTTIDLSNTKPVQVALCKDRHPMNITDFVFSNVDQKLMFDYNMQYKICCNWLSDNVKRNDDGLPMQKVQLFTTGLNCINASMIRACYKNKINLELYHYNTELKTYQIQVMYDEFEMGASINIPIPELVCAKIVLKNMEDFDDINYNEFYMLQYFLHNNDEADITLISNVAADVWKEYPSAVEKVFRQRQKTRLTLSQCAVIRGKLSQTVLSSSSNY